MGRAAVRSTEAEVLRIAREVAREARSAAAEAAPGALDADSSLERDLGLDSLGRAELVARLERTFGVKLPEAVLGSAETTADLSRALAEAGAVGAGSRAGFAGGGADAGVDETAEPGEAELTTGPAEAAPERTRTLVEVLEWHADRHPRRRHLLFYPGEGAPQALSYGDLLRRARRAAAGLRAAGVVRGQAVALMLPSGHEYFVAFCGVLLAGGVPVPLYPPARRSQIEDHLRRQAGILKTSQAVALITFPEVMTVARLLRAQVVGLGGVTTVADLEAADGAGGGTGGTTGSGDGGGGDPGGDGGSAGRKDAGGASGHDDGTGGATSGGAGSGAAPTVDDLALLQFTSGSTGRPKGVMLTHANLLANLRAIGKAVAIGPADVVVSWLPLYHDMGLIGSWMASLYYGMPLVLMSPLSFLARPARWLQALSRHRGTLSAAPNFAYELCARKVADEELAGVDLGAWRFALNGAEPVSPEAMRRFVARFRGHGFRPEAMAPVYGLAECSLALAFPPLGRGPVVDVIEREPFERAGRANPVEPPREGAPADRATAPGKAGISDGPTAPGTADTEGAPAGGGRAGAAGSKASEVTDDAAGADVERVLRFVGCGMPLPGHELRIVDAAGHEVGERQEGRLQFRGPSATGGYFRDSEATRDLRHGDWLESGDRAYTVGREVFITGRDKDIIIRAGRNLYPHEIEEAVGEVAGVRKGCVAVFGLTDRATGTERLVVLAETREQDEPSRRRLREAVQDAVVTMVGEPADEVVLAPPHAVPKTSSGKVRRAASRELYRSGRIGRGTAAVGLQLARLALAGARVQLGRAGRAAWAPLYSAYVWSVFALLGVPLWAALAVLPTLPARRRLARAVARLMFRCAGLPLRPRGLDHLAAWRAAEAAEAGRARPGCVVAVNHASYLDGIALTAMLPPDFAFVAKRELEDSFSTRVMMRRLGTVLVERFDPVQSAGEVPKAAAALAGGESLIIFPEGTFKRAPGLLGFHLGGFLAAAQAGAAVFPAVLHGTRHVFRDDAAIFRRGTVAVEVLPPIRPEGGDWAAAIRLRDRVRAAILERSGEPDLAPASSGGD
jgi:1-acyl-sn-glycerol-3-phosphate acyltransferase